MRRDQHFREQPSLFDLIARATDPPTSHIGAAYVVPKLNTLQKRMLHVWRFPATANEAAALAADEFGGLAESYRKRKKELLDAGLIRFVCVRACQETGRPAEVFEAVRRDTDGSERTEARF